MNIFARLLVVLTILSSAFTVFAKEYVVDAVHSSVNFKIRHLVSKVPGSFGDFASDFSFDEKKIEASRVNFTIQAKSVNTNNAKRDEHLRSADFFNVEKFPTITFKSTKVTSTSKNKAKLLGDLTMLGVTKPVTFDVEFLGTSPDPMGGPIKAGFDATGKINRKDFKMVWNKALDATNMILGDDVDLEVHVEAQQKGK